MDSKAGVKASAKASAKARAAAGAKQGTRAEPGLAAEALGRPSIKLIVSNRAALLRKYKTSGLASIRKAVAALAKADKARGIKTQLLFLDDAAAMKAMAAPAVKTAAGPRDTKAAIDAVCKALQPAWLMILGAPDVLPHQDLDNPAASPPDDPDLRALGRPALCLRCAVFARPGTLCRAHTRGRPAARPGRRNRAFAPAEAA